MITEFIVSSADIGTVFPAENHFILCSFALVHRARIATI